MKPVALVLTLALLAFALLAAGCAAPASIPSASPGVPAYGTGAQGGGSVAGVGAHADVKAGTDGAAEAEDVQSPIVAEYGMEQSGNSPPAVSGPTFSGISYNAADVGWSVAGSGQVDSYVTYKGGGTTQTIGPYPGTGILQAPLSNLQWSTTYTVYVTAKSSLGTSQGASGTFTTGQPAPSTYSPQPTPTNTPGPTYGAGSGAGGNTTGGNTTCQTSPCGNSTCQTTSCGNTTCPPAKCGSGCSVNCGPGTCTGSNATVPLVDIQNMAMMPNNVTISCMDFVAWEMKDPTYGCDLRVNPNLVNGSTGFGPASPMTTTPPSHVYRWQFQSMGTFTVYCKSAPTVQMTVNVV